jgi:hypothetical protein
VTFILRFYDENYEQGIVMKALNSGDEWLRDHVPLSKSMRYSAVVTKTLKE